MKTEQIVNILILSMFVMALTTTSCFAQAASPDVKKEPGKIFIQRNIEHIDMLGNYKSVVR